MNLFWTHKYDKYLVEASYDNKCFEVSIIDTENNKPFCPPLEFKKKFWREQKLLLKIVDELKQAGIVNIDIKDMGNDMENCYISECSEEDVHTGVVEIFKKSQYMKISPIIGQINYTYYTMFTTETLEENVIKNIPCLVFSDGKVIMLTPEEMLKEKIAPIIIPTLPKNRWSLESIEEFTKNPELDIRYFDRLCDTISDIFSSYIEFVDGQIVSKFLACWIIGTYLQPIFKAYPYVFLNGIKASGKTKTLDVAQQLAFNSINSANMSTSSLFRIIQSLSATVLIDESENLKDKDRSESFRELLLSGYKKGTQTFRVEEVKINDMKTYMVKEFNLFSPKMIANITGMEDILESRCISINMKPAKDQAIANKEINEDEEIWQKVRNDLYLFLMRGSRIVKLEYDNIQNDGFFKNREWELWKPILCVARTFGCYDDMLAYAKQCTERKRGNEIETNEYLLVEILLDLVHNSAYYPLKILMEEMAENLGYIEKALDKEGNTYNKGHIPGWLNSRYIGNVLKRFGWINRRRVGKGYEVFLKKEEVEEQALRMNIKKREPIELPKEEALCDRCKRLSANLTEKLIKDYETDNMILVHVCDNCIKEDNL